MKYVRQVCLITGLMLCQSLAARGGEDLQLTLPPIIYAVPGVEMNIYFDNIVLVKETDAYQFHVTCDVGKTESKRWVLTPTAGQVGKHALSIEVKAADGAPLAKTTSILHVVARKAGSHSNLNLLIIGDSLTHQTQYPNEIARLLSKPNNPQWQMLGTHSPTNASAGVAHEGYGGWSWQRFASHFEPNPDGTYRKRSSPFVYKNEKGNPQLDVRRYFKEECGGQRPDVIVIMLGINDCFSSNPNDPAAINTRVDAMFVHATRLLNALQEAAPDVEIGICLTTPPNSRQQAFQANYQDRYSRWGWKRIQHHLIQRQISRFNDRTDPAKQWLFIIPTQLNLDPVAGYPANNGVHPNTSGYKQIGVSIYAWLKSRMEQKDPSRSM